ncbi:hypothetical protein ACOJAH_13515, partial [Corynebacterium striatum]
FIEGHSITFELFGIPRHGGRLPFFPTQPGWISGVYQTGVRSIRRYTTSRPRTDAGKTIYALALKLTRVTTLDQTRGWTLLLHGFGQVFKTFLNEKTSVAKERRTLNNQWEWTHLRVRKAYNS